MNKSKLFKWLAQNYQSLKKNLRRVLRKFFKRQIISKFTNCGECDRFLLAPINKIPLFNLWLCPHCHALLYALREAATVCPKCKSRLPEDFKVCPKGVLFTAHIQICPNCGLQFYREAGVGCICCGKSITIPATTCPNFKRTPYKQPEKQQEVCERYPKPPPVTQPQTKLIGLNGLIIQIKNFKTIVGRLDFKGYIPEEQLSRISGQHFRVTLVGDKFYIADGTEEKPSTNGTKLNGREIKGGGSLPLNHGDEILVANVVKLRVMK